MLPDSDEKKLSADRRIGRCWIVVAAVLWSTSGFFAKAPLFENWPGPLLAFWRAAFASLVLLPLVRRPQWSFGSIPMVGCFAGMNYTYLTAMVKGEASNAIWLQNTAPTWVFLIGVFGFRERAKFADWILALLSASGVAFILFFELRGSAPDAVVYGLLSGIFYAGVVLSLRQLRDQESTWLVALNHLVTTLTLAPLMVNASRSGLWPSGVQWLLLVGFGVFQMGLPYVLFARGLKRIPGHEAAGIGLLEPLLLPLWVFVAWRHSPDYHAPQWWTFVGGSLIMLGLVARYLFARPPEVEPEQAA